MRILEERQVAELARGSVTIVKSALELGRENVSGVKFELRSSAAGPVTVEFVEEFPGHFSMSDVQVHPSYHPEFWTTSEARHRLAFEAELAPQSTIETMYGVRASVDDMEGFLGEPGHVAVTPVDSAEPAGEPEETSPEDAPPSTRHGLDGDWAADREPTETRSAESVARSPPSPTGSADGFEFGEDRRRRADVTEGPIDVGSHGPKESVDVGTLIERLARAELTDAQRARLREAVDLEVSRADQVQLDGFRSAVAELSGVAEAFGQVGETVDSLADLREDQAGLTDDIERLSTRAQAAAGDRDALRGRVEKLEGEVDDLRETHEADVHGLDARLEELEEVFTDSHELEAIKEVVAAERAWRDRAERTPGRLTLTRASTG